MTPERGPGDPGRSTGLAGLAYDLAPVVLLAVDAGGVVVEAAGALLPALGVDSPVGRSLDELGLTLPAGEGPTLLEGAQRSWVAHTRPTEIGDESVTLVCLTARDEGALGEALRERHVELLKFEALVDRSSDLIAMADLDETLTYVNPAGRELLGMRPDEEPGRLRAGFFPPEELPTAMEAMAAVRAGRPWTGESRVLNRETGEEIPVWVSSFLVRDNRTGAPLAYASVQRDLRAIQEKERQLARRAEDQRLIAEFGRLALDVDPARMFSRAVELVRSRTGAERCQLLRLSEDGSVLVPMATEPPVPAVHRVEVDESTTAGRAILERRTTVNRVTGDEGDDEGSSESVAVAAIPIAGVDGPWGVIGIGGSRVDAITDDDVELVEAVAATLSAAIGRYEVEERMRHQELHDPVTGLSNRVLMLDRIQHALSRTRRESTLAAVLLLDLDDFKTINESLGHEAGDAVLAIVGDRLAAALGSGDVMGRLGGDEFVVVSEGLTSVLDVLPLADRMVTALRDPVPFDDHLLAASASIGIALTDGRSSDATELLSEADIAMYQAKRDKAGSYRIFNEDMRAQVDARLEVAGAMRRALDEGEISVAYQPIVSLRTGQVRSLEALARWTRRDGGEVPTEEFIAIAEESGLIHELGHQVLRGALTFAAGWQHVSPAGVRINVSPLQLRRRDFAEEVADALRDSGFPPAKVGLEITESTFIDEDRVNRDTLHRLHALGVTLIIDDFGTGYSSLSYLQRFPIVEGLKIDRSFVSSGDGRDEAVIRAIVGLSKAFGLLTCAEGVETVEQRRRVTALGCDFAQGFQISRPLPEADVVAWLAAWQRTPHPVG